MEGGGPPTLRVMTCDQTRSDWVGYRNSLKWKIAKFPVEVPVNELRGSPDSAGLPSRGVARKESCWVPPVVDLEENNKIKIVTRFGGR